MKHAICEICYDTIDVYDDAIEFICKKGHHNVIKKRPYQVKKKKYEKK